LSEGISYFYEIYKHFNFEQAFLTPNNVKIFLTVRSGQFSHDEEQILSSEKRMIEHMVYDKAELGNGSDEQKY